MAAVQVESHNGTHVNKPTNGGEASANKVNGNSNGTGNEGAEKKSGRTKTIPILQGGRPDRAAFDQEQEELNKKIEKLQLLNNDVRAKISALSGTGGHDTDKKSQLRTEMDVLRSEQAGHKDSRQKILGQLKTLQDTRQRKIQELQTARSKSPFKSLEELDSRIKSLEQKVDSGALKLVDEKKALNEISQLKKSRKSVETHSKLQTSIDEDKVKIDAIRATLDHGESKAASEKYLALRDQMDVINKSRDAINQDRDQLFAQRNEYTEQINELRAQRNESWAEWKHLNERFRQKIADEKQRRVEREKNERLAHEETKRQEEIAKIRDEASRSAYEREIETCDSLISYLEKLSGTNTSKNDDASADKDAVSQSFGFSSNNSGLRQVDSSVPEGLTVLKKKDTDETFLFGGGGKKNKKGNKKNSNTESTEQTQTLSTSLQIPLSTMTACSSVGVKPPVNRSQLTGCVEELKKKKEWYQENQENQTQINMDNAEKKIAQMEAAHAEKKE